MLQEILRSHGYITLGVTDGGNIGTHLGFGRGFVEFEDRVSRNEYKRQQAAPNLKVTPKSFGLGRVFPITQRYRSQ